LCAPRIAAEAIILDIFPPPFCSLLVASCSLLVSSNSFPKQHYILSCHYEEQDSSFHSEQAWRYSSRLLHSVRNDEVH